MRIELTTFRLWDWRAAYCAKEASAKSTPIKSVKKNNNSINLSNFFFANGIYIENYEIGSVSNFWDLTEEASLHVAHNGACAHYVMVSKFQWKSFWLATQRDPQNDWTATQNRANHDIFEQAPLVLSHFWTNEELEMEMELQEIAKPTRAMWWCEL